MFLDWKTRTVNMSIFTETVYRFNAILTKNPKDMFCRNRKKKNLKSIWRLKRCLIAKIILKKNKAG